MAHPNAVIDPQLQYHDQQAQAQHAHHQHHQHPHHQQQQQHTYANPQAHAHARPLRNDSDHDRLHELARHTGIAPPPISHPNASLYRLSEHAHAIQQHGNHEHIEQQDDDSMVGDESLHGSPEDYGNAPPGEPGKTPEKRPRACDSCRGLKVRCVIDPASGLPCKRCAKARRQCIVTPPTRKRQKKADGRVAELERKIDALTDALARREASVFEGGIQLDQLKAESTSPYAQRSPLYTSEHRQPGPTHSPPVPSPDARLNEGPSKRRRLDKIHTDRPGGSSIAENNTLIATPSTDPEGHGSIYNQKKSQTFDHADIEQKISDIIKADAAEELFDRYVNFVAPRFPAVPFPRGTRASEIRKDKPILFLAILSSTSYGNRISDDIQKKLEAELRDVFAKALWKHGEKSLELIQALHVATLWYRPPANFEQHMFYQMVHMAAVMAIDIGIGKRLSPWRKQWFGSDPPSRKVPHYYNSIEAKRAWVVCYFLCISITMILRRPVLVRYNEYLEECIDILENDPDALESDKWLCQHARIAHVCEDIALQFAMDDPAVNVTVRDPGVPRTIKLYEEQLARIKAEESNDSALRLTAQYTNLYLHEIALHSQTNVDDFKGPWIQETFKTAVGEQMMSVAHINAVRVCQTSCRDILDTFLSYEFDDLYVLPVIFTGVRVIYATVVIIKLYIASTSTGDIAKVLEKDENNIEGYLARLQNLFKRIMDRDPLSPHVKFLWVIERLQERWQGIKDGQPPTSLCRSNGKTTPVGSGAEGKQSAEARLHPNEPAQGLHLLSEVAASSNGQQTGNLQHNGTTDPALLAQSQPPNPPQQQQNWYPQQQAQVQVQAQPQAQAQMANMPMDPSNYMYTGGLPPYDGFDYGLGSLGMGIDGAVAGLFVGGDAWNFPNQPQDPNNPGGFQGWQ